MMIFRVLLLSSVLSTVLSCKEDVKATPIQSTQSNKTELLVNSLTIINQEFVKQVISNGKIEVLQKSQLRFKTNERIASISVKNGQKVGKNQIIAVLDNEVLANQLNKSRLELDKANSKLQEEKINYGLDTLPESSIDSFVLRNLHMRSGYLEAKNTLNNARLLYNQTFLRSPINGVIANMETNVGNFITSADVFCTIINQKAMEVGFSISENELQLVTYGQKLEIIPFADTNKTYTGTVTEINPLVDENGLIRVKAKINNIDNSLFDGMNAKITINQPISDMIVVPKESLVLRSNREVVFTVENGLAKWNYVEVIDENSNSYAIGKGLKLGDTIIVSGNMNLSHDAKVNATFVAQEDSY